MTQQAVVSAGGSTGRLRESAKPVAPSGRSLHSIARQMLDANEGDPIQARIAMEEALAAPEVRRQLSQDAIAIAIRDRIAAVRCYERQATERQAERAAEGIARRANTVARTFMDWALPFGTTLSEATRPDILKAADHYDISAATHQRRAAWLRRVADLLPSDGVKVGAALTESHLEQAWGGQ